MDNTINVRILQKTDTETNWSTNNPILKLGELGISTSTSEDNERIVTMKAGDGETAWNDLVSISGGNNSGATYTEATTTTSGLMSASDKIKLDNIEISNDTATDSEVSAVFS